MEIRGAGTPITRWLVAAGASTLLGIGFAVQTLYPATPIAVGLFLLALMASNLSAHRGLTVLIAVLASAILLMEHPAAMRTFFQDPTQLELPSDVLMALAVIWASTAILAWDPRRRSVTVDALNRAFSTAPTGMAIVNLKGQIVHTNDTFDELLDEASGALTGQQLEHVVGETLWQNIVAGQEALARGESIRLRVEVERAHQHPLVASAYVRRLTNTSGEPSHYVVQLLDLSEALSREQALTSAENRFEQLFEHSNDLILTIDEEGCISSANPRACEVFAQEQDELIGNEAISLVQGEDMFMLEEALERSALQPGTSQRVSMLRLNAKQPTVIDGQFITLADFGGTVLTGREITEELASVTRLRASEARFSRIFHESPDAILIIRKSDQTLIDFNNGFTKLFGYTREQAIGTQNLLPQLWRDPDDRKRMYTLLEKDGICDSYISQLVTAKNETRFVDISLRYIEIDNEICVMGIGRDITEHIHAQEELADNQTKFSRVFTHSPDGIVILRQRDGIILDINDAFVRASGFHKSELINKRVHDLPVFNKQVNVDNVIDSLLARDGRYTDLEVSLTTKTGREIPCLLSATAMELGGEACTLCIARDVSSQRVTEEQLRESEERFRGTFENAPIGIILADTDGRIFHANHFAAELLAYKQDNLPGTHLSRLVPDEDRVYLKESLDRLLHGAENTSRSERRMLCQDGTEIWTNFHVVAQRSQSDTNYLIVQIADVTEMKNSQKRMERLAFYDTLTNLANRTLFAERLLHAIDHAQRRKSCAALMYLDLDQFKRVNDTLGHEAGDQLLREVASRLKECVRREDTVGRSGGDEFTVLLYDIKTPNDAGNVAEKILARLREPIDLNGHPLVVTTSIGITIIPNDGVGSNELMKNADLAMYRAKERGRNNFQFYSEEMNTNATKRLRTEYEIRSALENNEFELYYQPKVRMTDQRVVGMECLIRWDHPTRGLIGPHEFIEVAEETGAIVDIGNWVIRAACEAGRMLGEINGTPIYTAVNISPRQFRDPNLIQTIQRCLRQTKLNPNFLELEITETMLMKDIDVALVTLNRLADLGLRFAIDDFGTGYSSLNYLKKFPINTVKIDRSFIMDIPHNQDDMEISAAVIAMAHRLNMEVVAEGVETPDQLRFLQKQHCDYGQGYLFAKPLPFDKIKTLLTSSRLDRTA